MQAPPLQSQLAALQLEEQPRQLVYQQSTIHVLQPVCVNDCRQVAG